MNTIAGRSQTNPGRQWRILAQITVVVLIAVACGSSEGQPATTTRATTTTTASTSATTTSQAATRPPTTITTATVSPADEAAARSVTDAYFAAFNAGDADAVLALLTPDVTVTDRFGSDGQAGEVDVAGELASFTAQGTVLESLSCTVTDDQSANGTTVSCDYDTLDAPTQAVDALPVPTTTRFTVTSRGISEIHVTYVPKPG